MPLALLIALLIPERLPNGALFPDRDLVIGVTALGVILSQIIQAPTLRALLRITEATDDPTSQDEESSKAHRGPGRRRRARPGSVPC